MELGPSGALIRALVLFLERRHVKRIWSQEPDESKEAIRCRQYWEMVSFREPGMSTRLVNPL
jgi:hypothetical protein